SSFAHLRKLRHSSLICLTVVSRTRVIPGLPSCLDVTCLFDDSEKETKATVCATVSCGVSALSWRVGCRCLSHDRAPRYEQASAVLVRCVSLALRDTHRTKRCPSWIPAIPRQAPVADRSVAPFLRRFRNASPQWPVGLDTKCEIRGSRMLAPAPLRKIDLF